MVFRRKIYRNPKLIMVSKYLRVTNSLETFTETMYMSDYPSYTQESRNQTVIIFLLTDVYQLVKMGGGLRYDFTNSLRKRVNQLVKMGG